MARRARSFNRIRKDPISAKKFVSVRNDACFANNNFDVGRTLCERPGRGVGLSTERVRRTTFYNCKIREKERSARRTK